MKFLSRSRARFKDFSRAVPDLKTRVAQSCPWLHFAEKNSYRRHFIGFQETRWPCSWSQVFGNKLRDSDPKLLCFWGFITSKTESFYLHSQKKVLCHSFKCGISCIPCVTFDLCLPGLTILFSVRICHHQGTKGGGAPREKRVSRFKTPSKLTGSLHLHWIALDGESIWTRW